MLAVVDEVCDSLEFDDSETHVLDADTDCEHPSWRQTSMLIPPIASVATLDRFDPINGLVDTAGDSSRSIKLLAPSFADQ